MKLLIVFCLSLCILKIESFQNPAKAVMLRVGEGNYNRGDVEVRCEVSVADKRFALHEAHDKLEVYPSYQLERLWWAFEGPFIRGMSCSDGKPICLSCRDSVDNCFVDAAHCGYFRNERWFVKTDSTQTKQGPNGQIYFSIYSEMFPTKCITHNKPTNRFQLTECQTPPTASQSFFIDPDYFSVIQTKQRVALRGLNPASEGVDAFSIP